MGRFNCPASDAFSPHFFSSPFPGSCQCLSFFHSISNGIPLPFPVVCVGCLETVAAVHLGGIYFSFYKHDLGGQRVAGSPCGPAASHFLSLSLFVWHFDMWVQPNWLIQVFALKMVSIRIDKSWTYLILKNKEIFLCFFSLDAHSFQFPVSTLPGVHTFNISI